MAMILSSGNDFAASLIYEPLELSEHDELRQEAACLRHCQDGNDNHYDPRSGSNNPYECYGSYCCRCGCNQTIICPGDDLCRARIMRLQGHAQTAAVREWIRRGLCICPFVIRNLDRYGISLDRMKLYVATGLMSQQDALNTMNANGGMVLSGYQYTKASGNWSAAPQKAGPLPVRCILLQRRSTRCWTV